MDLPIPVLAINGPQREQTAQEIFIDFLGKCNCRCTMCQNQNLNLNPSEIGNHVYNEINGEGQFSDEETRVFYFENTKFKDFCTTKQIAFSAIKQNYEQYGFWNVQRGTQGMRGVKTLFRKCPINWGDLIYLNIPTPRRPGALGVGYTEHGVLSLAGADDLADRQRYNNIMLRNIKFCYLQRMMELQNGLIGCFRNPFVENQAGDWTTNFGYIENSSATLSDFVKILGYQVNSDVIGYYTYIKQRIQRYQTGLRLHDHRMWEHAREEGNYISHLQMLVKMWTSAYNIAHTGVHNLWHHLVRTQMDLAKLAQQVIEK